MSSVNKVILIGNLGADPEMRYTQAGKAVCELRMATQYGKNSPTEWHRVVLWEKKADLAGKYLRKGSKVYIEGRLQTRTYDDKEGVKRYITEVVANEMTFLDSKNDGMSSVGDTDGTENRDDGMPF